MNKYLVTTRQWWCIVHGLALDRNLWTHWMQGSVCICNDLTIQNMSKLTKFQGSWKCQSVPKYSKWPKVLQILHMGDTYSQRVWIVAPIPKRTEIDRKGKKRKKCHVSHVMCHMSLVTCQMSHFVCHLSRHGKRQFFIQARFEPKLFYPKKCVNCDNCEFATKQRKLYLTTSMSKIRMPHI